MNDANELWTSAWRQLQKNLANSFAAGGRGANDTLSTTPVPGQGLTTTSWLVRARSRKMQVSSIAQ